jgi:hypothetical protein
MLVVILHGVRVLRRILLNGAILNEGAFSEH